MKMNEVKSKVETQLILNMWYKNYQKLYDQIQEKFNSLIWYWYDIRILQLIYIQINKELSE